MLRETGCDWCTGSRVCLVDGELSDYQRAEAERLMARRNASPEDGNLHARLRGFCLRFRKTLCCRIKKPILRARAYLFSKPVRHGQRDPALPAAI